MDSSRREQPSVQHATVDVANGLDNSTVHGPVVQARDIQQLRITASTTALLSERYQAYEGFCIVWEELQGQILRVATSLWTVRSFDEYRDMVYRSESLCRDLELRHRRISLLDGGDAPSLPVLEAAKQAVQAVGPHMYAWGRGNDEAVSNAAARNFASLMRLNDAEAVFESFMQRASGRLGGGSGNG
ncbi:hypothetical protein OHA37_18000 [Streptomyces sp. NBC_00335]|uniref:hypothetical protein n=1 Tax=unclassified Streptomyces TaxID=2593676 RepID=UPI00224FA74F|nr:MULTISPECIES: hypothetical protein [unclassified Streptomyces]MCX5405774.1 hypothetical protein [Streptomyces sp. NBC_00086]